MKNILVVTIGLITGLLVGGGIIYLAQQKDNRVVNRPETKSPIIKETSDALTNREQELQKRLSENDNARNQLQAQVIALQKQLAEIKENGALQANAKEGELKDKAVQSQENMRRYAKSILAIYSNDDTIRNDRSMRATYHEWESDMMRLMKKYNINCYVWHSDVAELYKPYEEVEIRTWFGELGEALFEELGVPMTEAQIKALDEAMRLVAEDSKKLDVPNISQLEKAVILQKFQNTQRERFAAIFTDEQNKNLNHDFTSAMTGVADLNRLNLNSFVKATLTTRDEGSYVLIRRWEGELKLNEAEKQSVKYLADMYVSEYSYLKRFAEAEYGKEFMDYYLERYDRSDKDKSREWRTSRWKYFNTTENKKKQGILNVSFAELQLKYQKQLQSAFPDKQEQIKEQRPQITHFPYLGE